MPASPVVPDLVRQRAEAHGADGRRWLRDLPDVVTELAGSWDLEVGAPYTGGTASLVVSAADRDGRHRVVKIAMAIRDEDVEMFHRSVVAHRIADGRGCARLIDSDDRRHALLLEQLGPNLDALGLSVPRILDTVAATLRSFWRPVPDDCSLPTGAEQAEWLARFIATTWEELGRPCPRAVIDTALSFCDERASAVDRRGTVLVHGDAHGWNTLDAGDGSFKLVDPEGLRSEPAHDLGVLLREYNRPLLDGDTLALVRARAELLGTSCGVDPDTVWQWGFVERVSTGLANLRDFDDDDGWDFLEVAARCV
jgi:streptomycin 6-kinase